jgi:hypothetical protein
MKATNHWARMGILVVIAGVSLGCSWQESAVVGSALGAGAGAIIGHQTGHAGEGAAIGAGFGAVTGGLIGKGIEDTRRGPYACAAPVPPRHAHVVCYSHTKRVNALVGHREREIREKVWVPPRYEYVQMRGYDTRGNEIVENKRILVEEGHIEYRTRTVQEPVYREVEITVLN